MNSVLQQKAIPSVMVRANASGLFVSLCSIMQPDGVLIDAGQPSGNYIPVTGLQNIPCTAPPMSTVRLQAQEIRSMDDIQAMSPQHVLLSGWYPTIRLGVSQGWIAQIDGDTYILAPGLTLMGAESDSQSQMTRLAVRFASV